MSDDVHLEIAEAAGHGDEMADVSFRRCTDEYKYLGEYQQVDGIEYIVKPPCDLLSMLLTLRDMDDVMVMQLSLDDNGHARVFIPDNDPLDRLFA